MTRAWNFSAGPAAMPEAVLRQAASEMLDWHGSGMGVMEMSHRGKEFMSICAQAEADHAEQVQLLRQRARHRLIGAAVLVGIGTALADDPQLNVRLTKGKNPVRIVLDSSARLSHTAKVWHDDGTRRLWLVSNVVPAHVPPGVELVVLKTVNGQIDPRDILCALHSLSLRRVLIEGGAETVSRFMQAQCLDRLHLLVAPIIMGSGRPAFNLPAIQTMDEAVRLRTKTYALEDEIIYDIDLTSQRLPIDFSKMSAKR